MSAALGEWDFPKPTPTKRSLARASWNRDCSIPAGERGTVPIGAHFACRKPIVAGVMFSCDGAVRSSTCLGAKACSRRSQPKRPTARTFGEVPASPAAANRLRSVVHVVKTVCWESVAWGRFKPYQDRKRARAQEARRAAMCAVCPAFSQRTEFRAS